MIMQHFIVLAVFILHSVQGQICYFFQYNADCRYRVDGASMGHIMVHVNHCNNPVDVTFRITCEYPSFSWSHTFANDNEITDVKGFDVQVRLQVMLSVDNDQRLGIKAFFILEGQALTQFIDQKVHLTNLEQCLTLNSAGQIAVGILGALVAIAAILLVTLLYMRHQLKKARQQNLVENMESDSDSRSTGNVFTTNSEPMVRYLHTIPEYSETESSDMAVTGGNTNFASAEHNNTDRERFHNNNNSGNVFQT